jgi:hypothetical protein
MSDNFNILREPGTIDVQGFDIEGSQTNLEGTEIKEILLIESLLTQSPQTAVRLQSLIYNPPGKDFDQWKNKTIKFTLQGPSGKTLKVKQKVYRMADRKFMPTNVGQTEEFVIHSCDETLLEDAKCLVSKSWKCTRPSEIVEHVLGHCVKANEKQVDSADPARDYIAENIHPYQVIAQQANVALDGDDPSFLHFMTYENEGKHYFTSLKKMTQGSVLKTYKQVDIEQSTGYANDDYAINFSFPCDFDYLTDILNGVDDKGKDQNSGTFMDQVFKIFTQRGEEGCDCGIGQYNYKQGFSNEATAQDRNSCNLDTEKHLLKRQARMSLLDKDKMALRITVPCNLDLHVGKMIELKWINRKASSGTTVYGSGKYLIAALVHDIKLGGYSVTNMECVAQTAGGGQV